MKLNYFSRTTGDFANKTEQSCENPTVIRIEFFLFFYLFIYFIFIFIFIFFFFFFFFFFLSFFFFFFFDRRDSHILLIYAKQLIG